MARYSRVEYWWTCEECGDDEDSSGEQVLPRHWKEVDKRLLCDACIEELDSKRDDESEDPS